jgi:adenosylcobinamide amidohydrolase
MDHFWGMFYGDGEISHNDDDDASWGGQKGFGEGDVVGLLLDCDAGTLTVKKNGERLEVAITGGLTRELCSAACMLGGGQVRIAAADPATF